MKTGSNRVMIQLLDRVACHVRWAILLAGLDHQQEGTFRWGESPDWFLSDSSLPEALPFLVQLEKLHHSPDPSLMNHGRAVRARHPAQSGLWLVPVSKKFWVKNVLILCTFKKNSKSLSMTWSMMDVVFICGNFRSFNSIQHDLGPIILAPNWHYRPAEQIRFRIFSLTK